MAAIKYAKGTKLVLKVGGGETPTEVFTAKCTINLGREVGFDAKTNTFVIPDCTDPDAVGWEVVEKVSLGATFAGAGTLATDNTEEFFVWLTGAAKNCQIHLADVVGADGGGYWSGAFHLTQFKLKGDRGDLISADLSLVSTGAVTWTDAV